MNDKEKLENRKQYVFLSVFFTIIVAVVLVISSLLVLLGVFLLRKLNIIKKLPEITDASTRWLLGITLSFSVLIGTGLSTAAMRAPLRLLEAYIDQVKELTAGNFEARIRIPAVLRPLRPFAELEDSFNALARELGRNEVLRSDFIRDFSHEFKTPIVSISGFAKLLKKENLTDDQRREYLDIIETESDRLSTMAMNVMDMSKLDNLDVLSDVATFNVSEQIRHCVLLLEKKWSEKNQDISVALKEYNVSGNADMLAEVWTNLLDNAVKFTPEGGKITVSAYEKEEMVCVEVRNIGTEIPEKDLPRIFDKFYQVDPSHAAEGNGLGLAICKRIVELHEGTISVTSTFGLTVFTVSLPKAG
ncbi:MAG: HAMP domain-containing histidine kinase [Clostridia bacterium]|nr:HAMP domain-containing histidine kinase [Clostridia bacterium]